MAETTKTGSAVRKFITGTVAAGALLVLYGVGMVSVTGGLLTMSATPAEAQWRGRGWRGRGWRGRGWRGRGWRGRGAVCRHRGWSSRRICWRA